MITKVTAYIVRQNGLRRELLVFAHGDDPAVPIQVPAGTADDGEDMETAALREIREESGLVDVRLVRKLGSKQTYRADLNDYEDRHFFLYEPTSECPESWEHHVSGEGEDHGMVFCYSWKTAEVAGEIVPILAEYLTRESVPELFGA